jgi:hypothetical protein
MCCDSIHENRITTQTRRTLHGPEAMWCISAAHIVYTAYEVFGPHCRFCFCLTTIFRELIAVRFRAPRARSSTHATQSNPFCVTDANTRVPTICIVIFYYIASTVTNIRYKFYVTACAARTVRRTRLRVTAACDRPQFCTKPRATLTRLDPIMARIRCRVAYWQGLE